MTLSADSRTLSPLPEVLSHGLAAVSTFGLLSFCCSTSLFFLLTYRLIQWRRTRSAKTPLNQFLFLIYNLLLADIQQGIAFLLNIKHLANNAIEVGTPSCFAQGWFISIGDLASSLFICAIACHTFLGVVKNYRLPSTVFYGIIAALWFFVYFLAALGPLMHREDFYVRASAWCWISASFQLERLWLHYFWIFVCMFSTVLIYTFIFIFLGHFSEKSNPAISRATPLMILYPLIYVVCTAPLAAGRISALAGNDVSLGYFCAAGTMIACNGWLDVLLYASTRADIVLSARPPGEEAGLETFAFMGRAHRLGTTTTIEAGQRVMMANQGSDSAENLYGLDQIGVKGEVTVSVDVVPQGMGRHHRMGTGHTIHSESWDESSSRKSLHIEPS